MLTNVSFAISGILAIDSIPASVTDVLASPSCLRTLSDSSFASPSSLTEVLAKDKLLNFASLPTASIPWSVTFVRARKRSVRLPSPWM